MSQDGQLTTSFRKVRTIGPLHTSGPVVVTSDAKRVVTCLGEVAILTNVDSGQEICRFYNDSSQITAMTLSPSEENLVIITASLSIRIYPFPPLYSPPHTAPLQPSRHIPKAHDAPVHVATIDNTSTYLATGSADGVAKVWDLKKGFTTHSFKGHGGVISCINLHVPASSTQEDGLTGRIILATGSVDTRIRIFDLSRSNNVLGGVKPTAVLNGHVSVPRGIAFSTDGKFLVTAGRDSVVLIWKGKHAEEITTKSNKSDSTTLSYELVKTLPVSEAVETLGIVDSSLISGSSVKSQRLHFFIGGEKGVIHIWDGIDGKLVKTLKQRNTHSGDTNELHSIQEALFCRAAATIVSVHADQNIIFHSIRSSTITRQLIGFNDEIVDAVFLTSASSSHDSPTDRTRECDNYLSIATNSSLIRVYATTKEHGLNSFLLDSHTDTVLALDRSPDGTILASVGKDKSVRVWVPSSESHGRWECIAIGKGHAESVGALAIAKKNNEGMPDFIITGSQDCTIKLWDLGSIPSKASHSDAPKNLPSLVTQKAHDKDINSLDIAPNDSILATGSQDKTARLFAIQYQKNVNASLKPIAILKGHKRGIWNVKFSKHEKVLATASGDKTVKLWSIEDHTCLKTFEGHTNSVLRVEFHNAGRQLLTTASDGLMKLWNIAKEVCIATMDNHEDKVWALAVSLDEKTVVTAAADSVITFWEDSTELVQAENFEKKKKEHEDLAMFEHHFFKNEYKEAIVLALSTGQPRRLYQLFSTVSSLRAVPSRIDHDTGELRETYDSGNITGNPAVDNVIRTLPPQELSKLLRLVRDWNATARTSVIAQIVLHAIMKLRRASDIQAAFMPPKDHIDNFQEQVAQEASSSGDSLRDILDALIPYTERHLSRIDRQVQDTYILDFILREMDGIGTEDDGMQIDSF
ncbi:U3 small nucleolar RNA-associated protein 13 [Serendipita sp. 411]|nr:U3 small nucleolar RNA-associated protein 13 [Serendipita sp. 411]